MDTRNEAVTGRRVTERWSRVQQACTTNSLLACLLQYPPETSLAGRSKNCSSSQVVHLLFSHVQCRRTTRTPRQPPAAHARSSVQRSAWMGEPPKTTNQKRSTGSAHKHTTHTRKNGHTNQGVNRSVNCIVRKQCLYQRCVPTVRFFACETAVRVIAPSLPKSINLRQLHCTCTSPASRCKVPCRCRGSRAVSRCNPLSMRGFRRQRNCAA